ncbi:MAG: APC family permease [Synergistaceae bacterium]|nr:APC family permease [Synergistaceae bacterium]
MFLFNFHDNGEKQTLHRELTPLNVWSLAFGCVIGWSAYVMPGRLFLPNAGPLGTIIGIELATIVMLIISYSYGFMIKKFPATGGEFVYAKMAFGDWHGFFCAWFLVLSYLSVIPLNATALNLILRAMFGDVFRFGFHYTVAGYEVYMGEMIVALGAIGILYYITSKGILATGRLQTFMVFILLGGILILVAAAIMTPGARAANLHPMFRPATSNFTKGILAQIAAVFVMGPQSFVGFDTVPQVIEESNFSVSKVKIIMDTSIIAGSFVYVALTLLACSAFPEGYSSWFEYVNDIPNLTGFRSVATLNAAYTILGNTGLVVIFLSVIAAMLTGIVGFYTATSRLLYSMARDRMIPAWFEKINARGVPINAGIFCASIAAATSLLGRAVLGWVFDMASLGGSIGFAYTCMAACKYSIKEKRRDIAILGFIGAALSGMMALLLFIPIEGLDISLYQESYILLIIWTTLGVAFHVWVGLDARKADEYENLEEMIKASLEHLDVTKEIGEKNFAPIRNFDTEWEWGSSQDIHDYSGDNDSEK